MPNVAGEIMTFCNNPQLRAKAVQITEHNKVSESDKKELMKFFDQHIVDLYKTALAYSMVSSDSEIPDEEKQEHEFQFRAQLNYWWLEIQSEWIRYNNLLNYKLAISNERDTVLSAKASICTFFLSPVAKYLDQSELDVNIDFLRSLISRCQFEGLFEDVDPDQKASGSDTT